MAAVTIMAALPPRTTRRVGRTRVVPAARAPSTPATARPTMVTDTIRTSRPGGPAGPDRVGDHRGSGSRGGAGRPRCWHDSAASHPASRPRRQRSHDRDRSHRPDRARIRPLGGTLGFPAGSGVPAGQPITLSPVNRRQVLQATAAATLLVLAVVANSALRTSGAASSKPSQTSPTVRLVVIGTGGLSPADIDPTRTPNLWRLLREGSSAALNVTAVHANTCPIDGWLTLSAGNRAGQPDDGPRAPACRPIPDVKSGFITGWDSLVAAAANRPYGSRLGTLSQVLASHGQCISAIGPGAALGAAPVSDGVVPRFHSLDTSNLSVGLAACPTALVDVGAIRDANDVDVADPDQPALSHDQQLAAVDQQVGHVVAAAPHGADVVVVSLADAGRRPGLRVVLATGQGFGPGTLYSPST